MRRRLRVRREEALPVLALATLVAGLGTLLATIAVHNHNVSADEGNTVKLARWISADHSLIFTGSLARGPERLTSVLGSLAVSATDSAARQVLLMHVIVAFAQGLVAVPVWATARRLGLGRWPALVPAGLAAAGSCATYGVFLLDGPVGLICATALVWAMVRSLAAPGLVSDALIALTLGATMLGRVGWAPLVVALAPAVLAMVWFERPVGETARTWARALPRRLWRRHPLLVPLTVAVAAVIAVAGPDMFLGGAQYGGSRLHVHLQRSVLWDNTRLLLAHLALATAIVPFVLAAAALLRDLVRPAAALEGAFAWLVLGLLVAFSYAYYASLNEDRYIAVLVPPVALLAAVAAFRRPPPLWGVLVVGALVARLLATASAWPDSGPFDLFVAPSSLFFQRVPLHLASHLPILGGPHAMTGALLVALLCALGLAAAVRGLLPRRIAAAVVAAVLGIVVAYQVDATQYPARRFVALAGMRDVPARDLDAIDRAAGGAATYPVSLDLSIDPDIAAQLPFLRVYGTTVQPPLTFLSHPLAPGSPAPDPPVARLDARTGAIHGIGTPTILLQRAGFNLVGFDSRTVPSPPVYSYLRIERVRPPLRTRYLVSGATGPGGSPAAGKPLRVRVFPPPGGPDCLTGSVSVFIQGDRRVRWRLSGGLRPLAGAGDPGVPVAVKVPLRGTRPSTIVLRGDAVNLPDGSRLGPTLDDLRVARCA